MNIKNLDGKTLVLNDSVFGVEYNEPLVHQAVVAYMAGQRAGTKSQKSRSDVSGGGSKPWRQKGTGRARAGTTRGPIWRKGGVTFAARNRDFSQKLNKKMYRAAMRSIFSELVRSNSLVVVETLDVADFKTKSMIEELKKFNTENVLLVSDVENKKLELSSRNIPACEVVQVASLNPVNLVAHEKVVITSEAMGKIGEWLS